MRLFVAIHIPESIRKSIASVLQEFRTIDPNIKWIKIENLHLTLKFLGNTDASKLDSISKTLVMIRSEDSISVHFTGLGFFPNRRRPNILWAGIRASPNLRTIVEEIDQRLAVVGFPLEQREFAPHLTLARLAETGLSAKLIAAIDQISSREFGGFRATQFHLIESDLKSSGAEYTTLHSFSFVAEA